MLTLQEVESIVRNYRFKYDYNSKTYTLINRNTNESVTNAEEISRAKAGILLNHILSSGIDNVTEKFFNASDPDKKSEIFFNSLVSDLGTIIKKQQFTADVIPFSKHKTPIDFFINTYKHLPENMRDCCQDLINLIAKENGLKVDRFSITAQSSAVKTDFNCTSHIAQQTNTANKKIVVRKFVETLIEKYKQCEDDQNFEIRSNNEDGTMQRVVQVLDSSQPLTQIPNDFHKFMRMLISAQNLSISGERDFLKEIVMQDSVNQRLLEFENARTIDKMDSIIAQKQSKQEKLRHKETRGEIARRIANSCVEHNADQFDQLKYAIQNGRPIIFEPSLEGDRFRRIAELYATTQGHFDMFKDVENSIS